MDTGTCNVCGIDDISLDRLQYGEDRGDLFRGLDVCDNCVNSKDAANCSMCGGFFKVNTLNNDYECHRCHRKAVQNRTGTACTCEKCSPAPTPQEIAKAIPFDPELLSRDVSNMNFKVNHVS